MKFVSILLTVTVCAAMLMGLTACGRNTEPEESTEPTTVTTVPTLAPIIEKDLAKMITAEEISYAIGASMTEPSVSGQGTVLTSVGVESTITLNVEVSEKPREIFDQVLLGYPIADPCPNLGETAWYSSIYHHLLVYNQGYMMTVELFGYEGSAEGEMLACRQISALIFEHLVGEKPTEA